MVSAALHASFKVIDWKQKQTGVMLGYSAENVQLVAHKVTNAASLHNTTHQSGFSTVWVKMDQSTSPQDWLGWSTYNCLNIFLNKECFHKASTIASIHFESQVQ